ncbi:unnamed protein product [Penicillium olsonii]|uniref:F-box domain-containing protein n=1 Tax=Penicillium olsonii TaxID=99116 RepID=A0A9W4HTZ1_PENOL|nr:unnamed protein product [Penicillium olsonii]
MPAPLLPFDVLLQIFSYGFETLVPYARVCRSWQIAVEAITFADIHLESSSLRNFDKIIRSSNFVRCGHIRRIYFRIKLPKYSIEDRAQYENELDRRCNNNVFTKAISALLQTLSSWPQQFNSSVALEIYAVCPSDFKACPDWDLRTVRIQTYLAFPEKDILDKRFESSYLKLVHNRLSSAGCIYSLKTLDREGFRRFAPSAISQIVSHLPRLQSLDLALNDDEPNDAQRDLLRDGFTMTSWPSSLRDLKLSYDGPTPKVNTDEALPYRSSPGKDSLSRELHGISHQLKSLTLYNIMIDPELFWPTDSTWPILERFTLFYQPAMTSGTWYFDNDPDDNSHRKTGHEGRSSPTILHIHPNEHLQRLYLYAARAAQCMPRLRWMELEAELGRGRVYYGDEFIEHRFEYNAWAGEAVWKGTSQWHLKDEVREAWHAAARSHGRDKALIKLFHSSPYWESWSLQ